MPERIQKVLARSGVASRRQVERLLEQGAITINGQPAKLGDTIELTDQVTVEGQPVQLKALTLQPRILIYNKPEGEVCTRSDPQGRPTVFSSIPLLKDSSWVMVGRLDINSQGLLLFTNDGELANRLMHPKHEVEREYAVRVYGDLTQQAIDAMLAGIELDEIGFAQFHTLEPGGGKGRNRWYRVTLKRGRNREVRRLFLSQGMSVSRLIRIRYGDINLPKDLDIGQWRELERHPGIFPAPK